MTAPRADSAPPWRTIITPTVVSAATNKSRTLPRALADLAEHLAGLYPGGEPLWVSVMHGRLPEQAERLAGLLRERLNIGRLEVLRVSPVLGVHTGPGVVGAAVMPLQLLEEAGQA